ncbi:uncharacterized protein LOC113794702 isoform X2 [Dermatophagoides pteronyssinus]|uniref:uncharacterized protein LOC113794702 isoform X2 n=1 Tax=Dermatophagoides pteronyssinus TaxID=6956 RepID=UPI003F67326E
MKILNNNMIDNNNTSTIKITSTGTSSSSSSSSKRKMPINGLEIITTTIPSSLQQQQSSSTTSATGTFMIESLSNQQRNWPSSSSSSSSPKSPILPSYDMGVDAHQNYYHPLHHPLPHHHHQHYQLPNQHLPTTTTFFQSPQHLTPIIIPSAPNPKETFAPLTPPPPMLYSSTQTANSNYGGGYQSQNISNRSQVLYVYELPYNIRKSICDLLDADNSWRELGGRYMGFNDTQLTLISHALYRSASPTNELLTKWESSNAKIKHLFIYLAQMKHHRSLKYLLPFVDQKLRLMYETTNNNNNNENTDNNDDVNYQSFDHQEYNRSKLNNQSSSSTALLNKNIKQSTMKGFVGENSKFYPNQNHQNRFKNNQNNNNGVLDEEQTLIDLQNNNTKKPESNNNNNNNDNQIKSNENEYLLKIDDFKITYKELVIATDDFSNDNILGSGGFGTVYIGDWKGTKVAIKKLKGLDNLTQALTELRILNCCRIDNILPLYAVSLDGPEPCLIYQYMSNGSLEDRLLCKDNTKPLTWLQRSRIGEGIARALNFLHTLKGNPFVHGDVKSANILLDQIFEPKLGDFGLARQVAKNNRNENSIYTHCTVSSVNGTSVYLPAEYLRQKILSPAVDVYSYGIVILEMATGRRAYDGKKLLINSVEDEYSKVQNQTLQIQSIKLDNNLNQKQDSFNENQLKFLMDKRIVNQNEGQYLFNYLLELGRRCAHKIKSKRPIMVQILEYYNQCKATEQIYQLCDKVIKNKLQLSTTTKQQLQLSKTDVKNPIELQLWYDFVRKSCGTLSEIVFENFDAQVTKIIDDLILTTNDNDETNESTYYLDLLLCSNKNRLSNRSLIIRSKNNNNNNPDTTISTTTTTKSNCKIEKSTTISSEISINNHQSTNISIDDNSCCSIDHQSKTDDDDDDENLSKILKLINLDHKQSQQQSQQNDESTKNVEKNLLKVDNHGDDHSDDGVNDDQECRKNIMKDNDEQQQIQQQQTQQQYSTPFIPLLSALGFNTNDLDQSIIHS